MKIPDEQVAAFPAGQGAVVFVRCRADALDKVLFEALTKSAARALIAGENPKLSRDLARLFVCGWAGVTFEGYAVPYSWQLLEAVFPNDVLAELHKFVAQSVDILKTA